MTPSSEAKVLAMIFLIEVSSRSNGGSPRVRLAHPVHDVRGARDPAAAKSGRQRLDPVAPYDACTRQMFRRPREVLAIQLQPHFRLTQRRHIVDPQAVRA